MLWRWFFQSFSPAPTQECYGSALLPNLNPVPRILLPLLLCLTLIAGAVGSVWSATAMAMPMQAMTMAMEAGDSTHDCCHEQEANLQCDAGDADKAPSSCASGDSCDCKQHCNMLPSVSMTRLAPMRHALASMPALPSRDDVAPGQLNRPPIA